jgi:hypothetical protein
MATESARREKPLGRGQGGGFALPAVHHNAESYLDTYLEAAGIAGGRKGPLFRTIDKSRKLTSRPMDPTPFG